MGVTTNDICWAAGFIEGEGTFTKQSIGVAVGQVQREPLERLKKMFGGTIVERAPDMSGKYKKQKYNIWRMFGSNAAGLMMTIYPLMSPRRKAQILDRINYWKKPKFFMLKTHCKNGHEFTGLLKSNGKRTWRHCKICNTNYSRKHALIIRGLEAQ